MDNKKLLDTIKAHPDQTLVLGGAGHGRWTNLQYSSINVPKPTTLVNGRYAMSDVYFKVKVVIDCYGFNVFLLDGVSDLEGIKLLRDWAQSLPYAKA